MPKNGGKKKKNSTSGSDTLNESLKDNLLSVTWLPPPPALGEKLTDVVAVFKLLAAVEYKPLEEKDLYGVKISLRALKNLSPAEIRDLTEVFQTFDRNQTGSLKATELCYAMRSLGFNATPHSCEQYIRIENEDSSNKGLSLNQFLDLIIDRQHDSKDNFDEILNGFKMFDYDNSGVLTVENLRRACLEAGVKLSETELNDMIQEADVNGDGCVDQNEFVSLMVRTNLYSFN